MVCLLSHTQPGEYGHNEPMCNAAKWNKVEICVPR